MYFGRIVCPIYAFWVTIRPLGCTRQGEAEIRTLQYWAMQSQAACMKTHLVLHRLNSVGSKQ